MSTPLPEVISSEIAMHGFFDVRVDQLKLASGLKQSYYVVYINVHAAVILAKTKEDRFVIIREYRHPTGLWLLGCPGGRIDTGESPLEAAKRELLEETGYGNGEFSLLGAIHPFPAVTNQQIFYIYAKDVELIQPPAKEDFELIQVELKTEQELLDEIASGNLIDGVLCTALFLKNLKKI